VKFSDLWTLYWRSSSAPKRLPSYSPTNQLTVSWF